MESNSETIYLICQYNKKNSGRNVVSFPAAITWIDYLIRSFKTIGKQVEVVSYSEGIGSSYFSHKVMSVDENECVHFLPTLDSVGNGLKLRISQLFSFLQVILFIIIRTNKQDKVILYHDYGFSLVMRFVRKFVKRNYIIVLGEFFSAIYDKGSDRLKKEINSVEGAKGYIIVNSMMRQYVKTANNYCVSHGSYTYCDIQRELKEGKESLHVVYAGKISKTDITDAFIATEIARYVKGNFIFHILGYGTDNDINELRLLINDINKERGREIVSYDGCLSGAEYDQFLSSCDIGLCTRTLKEPNCDLCFPSKTLVYITHGLTVICPDAEFIRKSDIAQLVSFVDGEMTPQNIAKAMDNMVIKKCDYKEAINNLDIAFSNSLKCMINAI